MISLDGGFTWPTNTNATSEHCHITQSSRETHITLIPQSVFHQWPTHMLKVKLLYWFRNLISGYTTHNKLPAFCSEFLLTIHSTTIKWITPLVLNFCLTYNDILHFLPPNDVIHLVAYQELYLITTQTPHALSVKWVWQKQDTFFMKMLTTLEKIFQSHNMNVLVPHVVYEVRNNCS